MIKIKFILKYILILNDKIYICRARKSAGWSFFQIPLDFLLKRGFIPPENQSRKKHKEINEKSI